MTNILKVEREKESEIIAKIGNFDGLKNARRVFYQEQAQIRGKSGRIRVRRERSPNAAKYAHTQTTKHKVESGGTDVDNDERTLRINKMAYGMFLSCAGEFQRKTRYIFPLEKVKLVNDKTTLEMEVKNPVFEVDVFFKDDGSQSVWCKIDFEHQALVDELIELGIKQGEFEVILPISKLPFMPQMYFLVGDDMLPAQRQLRNQLYEKEWNRKVNVEETMRLFCGEDTQDD